MSSSILAVSAQNHGITLWASIMIWAEETTHPRSRPLQDLDAPRIRKSLRITASGPWGFLVIAIYYNIPQNPILIIQAPLLQSAPPAFKKAQKSKRPLLFPWAREEGRPCPVETAAPAAFEVSLWGFEAWLGVVAAEAALSAFQIGLMYPCIVKSSCTVRPCNFLNPLKPAEIRNP